MDKDTWFGWGLQRLSDGKFLSSGRWGSVPRTYKNSGPCKSYITMDRARYRCSRVGRVPYWSDDKKRKRHMAMFDPDITCGIFQDNIERLVNIGSLDDKDLGVIARLTYVEQYKVLKFAMTEAESTYGR